MFIRDLDELSTNEHLLILIRYLEVLSNGRAKPSRTEGYIRESMENIDEIIEVKHKINDILRVIPKRQDISVKFK